MKYILIFILFLTACVEKQERPKTLNKFKIGESVYVGKEQFIVNYKSELTNTYSLQKINCSSRYCEYDVLESEITKEPK